MSTPPPGPAAVAKPPRPFRSYLFKGVTAAFLAYATYLVLICPCHRLGRCHLAPIVASMLAAGAILLFDNCRKATT